MHGNLAVAKHLADLVGHVGGLLVSPGRSQGRTHGNVVGCAAELVGLFNQHNFIPGFGGLCGGGKTRPAATDNQHALHAGNGGRIGHFALLQLDHTHVHIVAGHDRQKFRRAVGCVHGGFVRIFIGLHALFAQVYKFHLHGQAVDFRINARGSAAQQYAVQLLRFNVGLDFTHGQGQHRNNLDHGHKTAPLLARLLGQSGQIKPAANVLLVKIDANFTRHAAYLPFTV